MALASNEIRQQQSLAMIHDLDNLITRLNSDKMNLLTNITNILSVASSLDQDSPEAKSLEKRRQMLAAYEKKIDAEIQNYQNKRKMAEAMLQSSSQNVDQAIKRFAA